MLTKTKLDAALEYAEMGYPVFPCVPNGKTPLTSDGFKSATTDTDKIEKWWEKHSSANIGIATSGLLVVDIDLIDGKSNPWPNDPDKEKDLVAGAVALTPRGGRHYIFKQPDGKKWKSTISKVSPKVDTRAEGGYIIAPPSIAYNKSYRWAPTLELDSDRDQLPDPPKWLIEELDNIATPSKQVDNSSAGNKIPSGQRNGTLARLGGNMRRVGMTQAEILASLQQVNIDRCDPPVADAEVIRISESVARYEPDQVMVAVAENHWEQDREASGVKISDPGVLGDDLLRIPGFISEVIDHSLFVAPYPNQVMAFSGAVALQAVLAGRKIRDPGNNRTNIYLLGLAHSASGKDNPRQINKLILNEAGLASQLGESFASGEGIQDALFTTSNMLYQTDEIDGMLQSINKAKDARHENIMNTLLTLYSSSSSIFTMRKKAGQESSGTINQPCLSVFGTAIPNHYYEALSDRMLTNGFFARMIILECDKRGEGQEPKISDIPKNILDIAKWWSNFNPGTGNLESWFPIPVTIPHTPEARKLLIEARKESEFEYSKAEGKKDPVGTTVWGRVSEHIRKFALIYSASENHEHPVIGKEAVLWATKFIIHQTRRMLFMAQAHVSDSQFHADCLKVIQKLGDAPNRILSHSKLLKRMKMDTRTFREIITTLEQQGDVKVVDSPSPGRPVRSYRLGDEVLA